MEIVEKQKKIPAKAGKLEWIFGKAGGSMIILLLLLFILNETSEDNTRMKIGKPGLG